MNVDDTQTLLDSVGQPIRTGAGTPVSRYLSRLGPRSQRTQQTALDQIAGIITQGRQSSGQFPWHTLTESQTRAVREQLAARYVPPTANRMISALRSVLKEAWRLGLMDAEAYHRASMLPNVPWYHPPRGRVLTVDEIQALFHACSADTSAAGARDAALLTVLYSAGLRRSEAAALDLADYDASRRELTVRGSREERERILYAAGSAVPALDQWIATRGEASGPFFLPVDKSGRIIVRGERMRDQSIYQAVLKRAEQAGIDRISCQDIRRTFITRLLEREADISTVQRLAGHCSITTTQKYDRHLETTRRRLGSMLEIPSGTAAS